ncbi:hypothetical protein TPA0598_02_02880 [Streptomyces lydicamycinicus]|uniref:Uncharacterized protein n=1 Tax=Streptomyces lydicamycinicus TaxID=1546107 RepID=A0A0P4R2B3_9ACTN|nr:hypothetical protein TPA0598_02_02880 [Streptomyces lydicamycinicus]
MVRTVRVDFTVGCSTFFDGAAPDGALTPDDVRRGRGLPGGAKNLPPGPRPPAAGPQPTLWSSFSTALTRSPSSANCALIASCWAVTRSASPRYSASAAASARVAGP